MEEQEVESELRRRRSSIAQREERVLALLAAALPSAAEPPAASSPVVPPRRSAPSASDGGSTGSAARRSDVAALPAYMQALEVSASDGARHSLHVESGYEEATLVAQRVTQREEDMRLMAEARRLAAERDALAAERAAVEVRALRARACQGRRAGVQLRVSHGALRRLCPAGGAAAGA